ncbi:hypothetical protein [Bradyrhizobium sp.]|jgi:hypothetical protein|uniref:hypothetical protein n=1 Tax=Bradyrhizobium sp. TaxID=376 RepID=UPI002DDD41F6|nr:hypothetical protein [Bradyrhizobium sp.]HEV2155428.1 hypothetical protein [Bradyrhizobium sp.]
MTRKQILAALKAAGAANDRQAWTRLYVENRVSLVAANQQWREGQAWAEFIKYRNERVDALLGQTLVVIDSRPDYGRDRLKGAQGD